MIELKINSAIFFFFRTDGCERWGGWVQWVSTCNSVPFLGGGGRVDCFGAVNVAISWSKRPRILNFLQFVLQKKKEGLGMVKNQVRQYDVLANGAWRVYRMPKYESTLPGLTARAIFVL